MQDTKIWEIGVQGSLETSEGIIEGIKRTRWMMESLDRIDLDELGSSKEQIEKWITEFKIQGVEIWFEKSCK